MLSLIHIFIVIIFFIDIFDRFFNGKRVVMRRGTAKLPDDRVGEVDEQVFQLIGIGYSLQFCVDGSFDFLQIDGGDVIGFHMIKNIGNNIDDRIFDRLRIDIPAVSYTHLLREKRTACA